MERVKVRSDLGEILGSILVAFYAVAPTLNLMMYKSSDNASGGVLPILYICSFSLIVLTAFIYNKKMHAINRDVIILIIVLLFAYILTPKTSTLSLTTFLVATICSLLVPQVVRINGRLTLLTIMLLPSIGIFHLEQIFMPTKETATTIGMDITYYLLLPIISSLFYCAYYFKDDNFKVKMLITIPIICNLVYLFFCVLLGSRGPSLCIILSFLFIVSVKLIKDGIGYRFKKIALIILLIIVIIALNIVFFAQLLFDALANYGIDAATLQKIIDLASEGNLSNGRDGINKSAIDGILVSPIWGYGLSNSLSITGYEYPHNFILQLLLDGGIILFSVVMIPMIRYLIILKKNGTKEEFTIIMMLFFASIPGALFSLDLWSNARVWLFMGFLMSRYFSKQSKLKYSITKNDS